jgi:hypothetical protein
VSSEQVRDEIAAIVGKEAPAVPTPGPAGASSPNGADDPAGDIDTPIYAVDGLVRRARALQRTLAARRARGETA